MPDKDEAKIKAELQKEAMKAAAVKADQAKLAKILKKANGKPDE